MSGGRAGPARCDAISCGAGHPDALRRRRHRNSDEGIPGRPVSLSLAGVDPAITGEPPEERARRASVEPDGSGPSQPANERAAVTGRQARWYRGPARARPRSRRCELYEESDHRWPIPSTPTPPGVPASPDLPAVERRVLDHWAADKTFEASVDQRAGRRRTAATSTSSTTARRSPTACRTTATCSPATSRTSCRATRPCAAGGSSAASAGTRHGLPAEVEAEKQLGITTKARDPRAGRRQVQRGLPRRRCCATPRTGSATSPARPAGSTSPTTTRRSTWTTWRASCGRSRPCTTRAWSTRASGCWPTAGGARRRCPTPRPGWTTSTGTGRTRR